MNRKFSLNRLLHNNRFIMALSLIAAIVVWALISFGPSNTMRRELTLEVSVPDSTFIGYDNLRVTGQDTFSITVTVEGPRSAIWNLNSDDLIIRTNAIEVKGSGKNEVQFSVSKGGKTTDYDIVGISPAKVTVECDYWDTISKPLQVDISSLSAANDYQFLDKDRVVIDNTALVDGAVSLQGPRKVLDAIDIFVAKVEANEVIANKKRFSSTIIAKDKNGNDVDLSNCEFENPTTGTVDLIVPVLVKKTVDLNECYQWANVPEGLDSELLAKLSVASVTLSGEEEDVNRKMAEITNLGVIDFDRLLPSDYQKIITLTETDKVEIVEADNGKVDVTITLDIRNNKTKTLSYTISSSNDVVIQNLPNGKKLTLDKQTLNNIVICGPANVLKKITAKNLRVVIDASGTEANGAISYNARIEVPNYPTVWVYYGEEGQTNYTVYGTIE